MPPKIDPYASKLHSRINVLLLVSTVVVAATVFAATPCHAFNVWTGNGTSDNWTDAGNWDNGSGQTAVTGMNNDVHLAGSNRLNSVNDYNAFVDWRSVLFDSGASSFNLTSTSNAGWNLFFKIENNSINAQSVTIPSIALASSVNGNEFDPTSGNLTITANDIFTNGHTLNVFGTQTLTINNGGGSGIQQGGNLLLQTGFTGSVILNGTNTYTGGTTVNGGMFLANGGTAVGATSATGTGAVIVNNTGSVLGGTGRIAGATTLNAGTKITGAMVGTVGTLTLASTATFSGASSSLAQYAVDISGATSDRLTIGGALGLSGAFDQISFSGAADGTTTYILATYGSVSGTFDTVTGLPSGYQLIYGAGELDLAPVPEPSTWAAAALAFGALAFSQRRKLARLFPFLSR